MKEKPQHRQRYEVEAIEAVLLLLMSGFLVESQTFVGFEVSLEHDTYQENDIE